jgi:hypothetical protein
MSVAAASDEPPPSPAPEGISFMSAIDAPPERPAAATSARTARTTKFDSSSGAAPGGVTSSETISAGWSEISSSKDTDCITDSRS